MKRPPSKVAEALHGVSSLAAPISPAGVARGLPRPHPRHVSGGLFSRRSQKAVAGVALLVANLGSRVGPASFAILWRLPLIGGLKPRLCWKSADGKHTENCRIFKITPQSLKHMQDFASGRSTRGALAGRAVFSQDLHGRTDVREPGVSARSQSSVVPGGSHQSGSRIVCNARPAVVERQMSNAVHTHFARLRTVRKRSQNN